MINFKDTNGRKQVSIVSIDDLVPKDHLLRKIEKAVDWKFIYEEVKDKYSEDNGRPSVDPVVLIKMALIQYLYGIKSMRQTVKEIEVNVAYKWFLGYDLLESIPHFSTFSKNYTRRFKGTDLFEKIFSHVLALCMAKNYVDMNTMFVDATHVKASANRRKYYRELAALETKYYEEQLMKEINEDREGHGKDPFDGGPKGGSEKDYSTDVAKEEKTVKVSETDPDSGWFRKGDHKEVFAYGIQTACDKNGWIIDYTVNKGNKHDSVTFKGLYDKLKKIEGFNTLVADAGYKNVAIAKTLIDDGILPIFPYTRPMTKKGFFKKYEYVYDEQNDCYICPNNKLLEYRTTNRKGLREYASKGNVCEECPFLKQCTESKNHIKVITRHIWEKYIELCEDIRCTLGIKEIYDRRKETIERIFGQAKENHGFRYTTMVGREKMEMKARLTFTCMNLKKLVMMG